MSAEHDAKCDGNLRAKFGPITESSSTSSFALTSPFSLTEATGVVSPRVNQNVSPARSTLPRLLSPSPATPLSLSTAIPPAVPVPPLSTTLPSTIVPLVSSSPYGPSFTATSDLNKSGRAFADNSMEKIKQMIELARQLNDRLLQFLHIKLVPAEAQAHLTCLSTLRSQLNQYKSNTEELCMYYSVVDGISDLKDACQRYYRALVETIDQVTQHIDSSQVLAHDQLFFCPNVEHNNNQACDTLVAILEKLFSSLSNVALLESQDIPYITVNQNGEISVRLNMSKHTYELFSELYSNRKHHDVTFRIEDKSIPAHRIILAAHSEYFDNLLYKEMDDGDIILKGISLTTFELLLKFLYTGRIDMMAAKLEGILELMEAADKFSLDKLKDALAAQLYSLVSVPTVLPLLLHADRLGMNALQEVCTKFLDENASSILQDKSILSLSMEALMKLLSRDTLAVDEMLVCNAVKLWMDKNNINATECQCLIQCIRLSELSCESLVDLVGDNQLFSSAQILDALKIQTNSIWSRMNPRGQIRLKDTMKWMHIENASVVPESINFFISACMCSESIKVLKSLPVENWVSVKVSLSMLEFVSFWTEKSLYNGIEDEVEALNSLFKNTNLFADNTLAAINSVVQWKLMETRDDGDALSMRRPGPSASFFSTSNIPLKVEDGPPLAGFTPDRPGYLFTTQSSIPSEYSLNDIAIRLYLMENQSVSVITAKFSGLYLLNHLVFEGFAESNSFEFSYSVEISKDDITFNTLIDYNQYCCHGCQELVFPTQAIHSFRIKFVFDPNNATTKLLHLLTCQHSDNIPQYHFRDNGIQGPLEWYSCLVDIVHDIATVPSGQESIVIKLTQPYYLSQLRFELISPWPHGTVGDVYIAYGIDDKFAPENVRRIYNLHLKGEPQTDENIMIETSFAEQIITIFKVSILNVIATDTELTTGINQFDITNVMIKQ